ncbi:MAG: tetratricopeptide repeat protein [Candidatus Riflebacteria bacterium]|nr:tetratricopeptide repeat protein [Candidatus Riflebacteria bacterium]
MHRTVLGLILVGSLTVAPGWAQTAEEWFQKAVYTTNPDHQIRFYHLAIKEKPDYHQAVHNLANAYYRKGEIERAIAWYERIIREGRAYYQTFYNLACCYGRLGDVDHSLKALKRAVDKGFKDRRLIQQDSDLAEVRSHPEFARIVARSGSTRAPGAVGAMARLPRPVTVKKSRKAPEAVAVAPETEVAPGSTATGPAKRPVVGKGVAEARGPQPSAPRVAVRPAVPDSSVGAPPAAPSPAADSW